MLSFFHLQAFNKEWHKIHFSVDRDSIQILIDCQPVQVVPIEPRSQIDVNGNITIGKRLTGTTVGVSMLYKTIQHFNCTKQNCGSRVTKNCYLFYLSILVLTFIFQFDLQWMVMHCDPTKPERENCDEIPVSS